MNATVANVITIGTLIAMYMGYQGHYLIGIIGIIVYIVAVICALVSATMRGDTAMVLCIIFIPVIGVFCAISKYCSDKSVSKGAENIIGRLFLLIIGGGLGWGGTYMMYSICKTDCPVWMKIIPFAVGLGLLILGIIFLLCNLGKAKAE